MLTKFVTAYYILFAAIYFTKFDVSPSTSYSWRFVLFVICGICALLSIKDWKTHWTYLGFGILFLTLVEISLTMTATDAYFGNPQNVDFFAFYAFNQDPWPFYFLGFKVRGFWFMLHGLAALVWFFNKPDRRHISLPAFSLNRKLKLIGGTAAGFIVLLLGITYLPVNYNEEREMQVEEEEPKSVAEAVLNGKDCRHDQSAWICDYKIGNHLKFRISNVNGVSHIEIMNKGTFDKSDYYLDMDSMKGFTPLPGTSYLAEPGQGCLTIKVGENLSLTNDKYSESVYAKGYISPEDGNVYSFENECSPAQNI